MSRVIFQRLGGRPASCAYPVGEVRFKACPCLYLLCLLEGLAWRALGRKY